MKRERRTERLTWIGAALLAIVVAVGGGLAAGQGPPSAKEAAAEKPAEKPVPEESALKTRKQFRPRLPNYYGRVVSEKQRKEIYGIQREYFPKIEALQAQLAALIAERDEKVAAVLTAEQLKQVEKFRAEAESKRKRGKAGKEKAGAATSSQ